MSTQHKKQRELIRSVEKAAEKANAAYGRLHLAMQIAPGNKLANEQYLAALNFFINSCNKITLETQIAFGENSDDIGFKQQANEGLKPHLLN